MTGLRVLARGNWPRPGHDGELPPLPGFSASTFNPLVAAVAELCLAGHYGSPDAAADGRFGQSAGAEQADPGVPEPPAAASGQDGERGAVTAPADRTALVLASAGGDRATALAIDTAAASGRRMPPLLFFQSNPNAVLGHIAARWRLTGPVVAISPQEPAAPGEIPADALEFAALLLADGDAEQVLLIAAEQAEPDGLPDRATAVLVTAG